MIYNFHAIPMKKIQFVCGTRQGDSKNYTKEQNAKPRVDNPEEDAWKNDTCPTRYQDLK